MAVQTIPASSPPYRIDLEHAEYLVEAVSAVTFNPFTNAIYYFFPFAAALRSKYIEINDSMPKAIIPNPDKANILQEIKDLTQAAGIRRTIVSYTAINHTFSNCGGSLSLTNPALFIPNQHLHRSEKKNPFTQETPEDALAGDICRYTDDETRFLIARELGHIRENDQLLRIAAKVALIAALFVSNALPITWLVGVAILVSAVAIHFISEHCFQKRMDLIGVDILAKRLDDRPRAKNAALSALEKMRQYNLSQLATNKLCRLYITKQGNNLLDFNHPFLTSRIERLRRTENSTKNFIRIGSSSPS